MKVDLWHSSEDRCVTVGTFAWIWNEGDILWGGQGPSFGNDDPSQVMIAELKNGYWMRDGAAYTDWDAQKA